MSYFHPSPHEILGCINVSGRSRGSLVGLVAERQFVSLLGNHINHNLVIPISGFCLYTYGECRTRINHIPKIVGGVVFGGSVTNTKHGKEGMDEH